MIGLDPILLKTIGYLFKEKRRLEREIKAATPRIVMAENENLRRQLRLMEHELIKMSKKVNGD